MIGAIYFCLFSIISTQSIIVPKPSTWALDFTYHTYDQMAAYLHQTVSFFPNFTSLYSIGRSVKGRELWVLKISSPSVSSIGTPHVKLIGNIHGNEVVGKEILLHFIHHLLDSYEENYDTQVLLNYTILHIMPSMNPDGFMASREGDCDSVIGRNNANAVDLNRNFPDRHLKNQRPTEPETQAVIRWFRKYPFVLSASLHGGALVANYPLDSPSDGRKTMDDFLDLFAENETFWLDALSLLKNLSDDGAFRVDSAAARAADDDILRHLAKTYAKNHLTMHKGPKCSDVPVFPGGVTNGAAWYPVKGGMQDFNYLERGCMELTLEISCCKFPLKSDLPNLWRDNLPALVALVKEAHRGVRGQVLDAVDHKPVLNARLTVEGRDAHFSTSQSGEFWRILLPGDYLLNVHADGYESQEVPFQLIDLPFGQSTWVEINLRRSVNFSYRASQIDVSGVSNIGHNCVLKLVPYFLFFGRFYR